MLGTDGPSRDGMKMAAGPNLVESQDGNCVEDRVAPTATCDIEGVVAEVSENLRRAVVLCGVEITAENDREVV